ncbi:MAG TPA: TlpA disulfide reductase family protein [Methylomirabilota bacterium]|jgi:thiol-disulfide isomerase/thioredoxin|nr:TlpA disulfide reductase family protein [Methylomirabilota bacterium]
MGPRLSVLAGLVAGILVALAVLAGVILAVPTTTPPSSEPSPSAVASAVTPSPSPSALLSPSPSAVASPSASASSSADASLAASASATANFHVGETAPALAMRKVGGGTIDLATMKGKAVWVNFMQTTCPPCVDEFPIMSGFAARYADKGLVVVAVDIREDEGTAAAFAKRLSATFPVGLDPNGAAQQAWGAYGLPVHFWIDKTGIVRDGALGGIGPDVMARGVASILPGVSVTP